MKKKPKKKAKPPPKAKAKAKSKGSAKTQVKFAWSQFLKEFRDKVIDKGTRKSKWPPATMSKPDDAAADFAATADLLFRVVNGATNIPPPPAPGTGAGTGVKHVADLMVQLPWPKADATDIPSPWKSDPDKIRRFRNYEVAWALNFMLNAYANSFGGNNPPASWPPPTPKRE